MMDETFHLTPLDVRRYEFGTALRGYDRERVDQFREQVATELERLGRINADGNGIVHIYTLDAGKMGALIGSEEVHGGTNPDVRVPLIDNPKQDAMAVLEVGGQVVATQEVRFN